MNYRITYRISFSTRGESDTHFLLCWLFLHRPQPTPSWTRPAQSQISISWTGLNQSQISTYWPNKHAAHPVASSWTARPRVKNSTNVFFPNNQILPSGHDVIHPPPVSFSICFFFIMTFVIVISSVHGRELYSMCAPAPALSWIVQSPTKPNDKI